MSIRLGDQQVQATFRAVNELLKYRDVLPESLASDLRELGHQLSETLCPYTTEKLDAHKRKLDERFPEYEHWYIRWGTCVTWCDRLKMNEGGIGVGRDYRA
jgi:hypothetical protein